MDADAMFEFSFEEMTSGFSHENIVDMRNESDYHPKPRTSGRPVSLMSSRQEDMRLLDKISSMLHKKKQKTNHSLAVLSMDEDRLSTDSSGFGSLTSRAASVESGSEDGRAQVGFTDIEREAFVSEGLPLPYDRPMNKTEERTLKRIRRKIKNKLSAQESRRKKKEYVEGLEKQLDSCSVENTTLRDQVCSLNNTVRSLLLELQRLQKEIPNKPHGQSKPKTQSRGIQTGTCLGCALKNGRHR